MKTPRKAWTVEDYQKASAINSMKLVRLVRSNEELYNSAAEGYNDRVYRDLIWERINKSLFPQFNSFDEKVKEVIRSNIRRRWKTLRNSISREIKKTATVENYCRKKESPVMSELEFLIPHIKSAYGTKFAEEMGLKEHEDTSVSNETNDEVCVDESDFIDLTQEIDLKPIIKADLSITNDGSTTTEDNIPAEVFYPDIQLSSVEPENVIRTDSTDSAQKNTRVSSTTTTTTTAWNKEYCTVAEFKEGKFTNSTVLCTEQDNEDNIPATVHSNCENTKQTSPATSRKRRRTETEESGDIQTKILQLFTNIERRERVESRLEQGACDEDRMFLLSLVSDLKRVPASKKMIVKAEIATAIAKAAIQQ